MIHPRLDPISEEYYSLRMDSGHPFTEVEFIELDHVVTGLTLFEFNRSSFFGFVQSEGKIVLVDPSTRQMFIMTCADHPDHIGQVCHHFFSKTKTAHWYFLLAASYKSFPRPSWTKGAARRPHGLRFANIRSHARGALHRSDLRGIIRVHVHRFLHRLWETRSIRANLRLWHSHYNRRSATVAAILRPAAADLHVHPRGKPTGRCPPLLMALFLRRAPTR